MDDKIILIIYIAYLLVISIFALFFFKKDKQLAVEGKDRFKEATLLSTIAMGGAIGGFLGRIIFHHKTDKVYFSIIIYVSLLLQITVLALMIYTAFNN